jgi:hypothetical protein
MLELCRNKKTENIIIDMSCPLAEMREILNPDIVIWLTKEDECDNIETKKLFNPPTFYDMKLNKVRKQHIEEIIDRIKSKRT